MWACFRPKASVPDGDPNAWSRSQVKQWFAAERLNYKSAHGELDGKKLVESSRASLERMCGGPQPGGILFVAVNNLKQSKGLLTSTGASDQVQVAEVCADGVVVATTASAATTAKAGVAAPTASRPEESLQAPTAQPSFDQLEFTDRVTADSQMAADPAPFALGARQAAHSEGRSSKVSSAGGAAASVHGQQYATAAVSGAVSPDDVRKVFDAFASFGAAGEVHTEMDGTRLMKLARECGLLDDKLTSAEVDLMFAKAKNAKRRIGFESFMEIMGMCADKKGVTAADLLRAVVSKGGPDSTGTRAQSVRLYDDKSLYTGVAKQGGPTTVEEPHDLATILDRGSRRSAGGAPAGKGASAKPPLGPAAPLTGQSPFSKSCVMSIRRQTFSSGEGSGFLQGDAPDLQSMFEAFAAFGMGKQATSSEMDRSRFAKLCRDCALCDTTEADIVFAQHVKRGHAKMSFVDFKACLQQIARDKGREFGDLERNVITSGGPLITTACV